MTPPGATLTSVPEERPRQDPVFVLGYSRSGTTLLRLMLDANPGLCVAREHELFLNLPGKLGRGPFAHADVERIADAVLAERRGLLTAQQRDALTAELSRNLPGGLEAVFASVHRVYQDSLGRGAARWGAKKPQHWRIVNDLEEWFPGAQFVSIVREPRDVVASMLEHFPHHVRGRNLVAPHLLVAWQWRRAQRELHAFARRCGERRFLELRYEDLVGDPREVLSRVCTFLGLPFDEAMLRTDRAIEQGRAGVRSLATAHQELRKAAHGARVGRFSARLSPRQAAQIAAICSREMQELGYDGPAEGLRAAARFQARSLGAALDLTWSVRRLFVR